MVHFDFEQRGGRCKLLLHEAGPLLTWDLACWQTIGGRKHKDGEGLDPLPFRQCLPEEIREALRLKEAKVKATKEARRSWDLRKLVALIISNSQIA